MFARWLTIFGAGLGCDRDQEGSRSGRTGIPNTLPDAEKLGSVNPSAVTSAKAGVQKRPRMHPFQGNLLWAH